MIDVNKIIKFVIVLCFKIFLCIYVFIGILYLIYHIYDWYIYERHTNKIEVLAEFGNERCINTEYPLAITIKNKSSKTIEYSTIDIKVSYIGHSDKLNDYGSFEDDRIIKSGHVAGSCWKIKSNESSYSYPKFLTAEGKTVKVTYTRFRFENN